MRRVMGSESLTRVPPHKAAHDSAGLPSPTPQNTVANGSPWKALAEKFKLRVTIRPSDRTRRCAKRINNTRALICTQYKYKRLYRNVMYVI